ncbi:TPA: sulfatase-like hydrolase/transferase [Salmonella enterica subsp. enterica serovar Infantis]|nr:sulfatase-like hydrolase/transferase [Salmonella enterica subsp. enterica serovar Infantis]HCD0612571.1 sulfatase-like hydrolase/transferase [Salmonella enterica subsp. enterica serovar Infantis]
MKILKTKIIPQIILATLITGAGLTSMPSYSANVNSKPNIIIYLLDDAGYADISVNGGKYPTPNIDNLANSGKNFTSFYVSSPICSPSRAGLMTGKLENKTGMYGVKNGVFFESDPDGLPKKEKTIPEMLKENGYKTAMLGKWHLGIGKDNTHLPTRHGFDQWWGIPTSNDMFYSENKYSNDYLTQLIFDGKKDEAMRIFHERELLNYNNKKTGDVKNETWSIPVFNAKINKDGSFDDTVQKTMQQTTFQEELTNRAITYINDNKNNPFFLYIAPPQNHIPLFVSERFKGKTDTPYGDVMLEQDWSIGEITKTLKNVGIDDNTIIIFSSDNGPWLRYAAMGASGSSSPYREGKGSTFEGGMRVPGIIKWSGKIKPGKTDEMMSTLDLLPTLASITHSTLPKTDLDGVDNSAMLLNDKKSARTVMPFLARGKVQAYRSGDYKINFYESASLGALKALDKPSMYNLKTDVAETNDISANEPETYVKLLQEAKNYKDSLTWLPGAFELGAQQKDN